MSCFGFIGTWVARKKEKRRAKKKLAISARTSVSKTGSNVDIRVRKGGMTFEVLLDNRPPTPFRGFTPRPGVSRSESDRRVAYNAAIARGQQIVENKARRAGELSRKREMVPAPATADMSVIEGDAAISQSCEESHVGASSSGACH